ncbi:MAG TPA: proline dehydrogenase family protein [Gemmatimonadales bacterium]|jgi:proline dehydrogenase|nr:proline dehydrogenase family protein [Gemmatimonadales bacterium]
MALARSVLLRASRSQWLARQLRDRAFFRRAVRRFLPGESLDAALDSAAEFAKANIGAVLTELGEQVTSRAEAEAVRDHYLGVFDRIRRRSLPAQVSVKLTHLGLEADRDACVRDVLALAAKAEQTRSFLWIDMEESRYVDATLDVYRRVKAEWANVGVCLQAYLRRTAADLEALFALSPAIRLVKGAYNEPADVAFSRKRDVDANYFKLAGRLLSEAQRQRAKPVFGTHDFGLIARIREAAAAAKLGAKGGGYEFHLLYGIRAAEQRALAAQGVGVRVLISYGSAWFAWYMRRLAERPANLWFVVRNLV